jgi:outer membrane lipoprotein LolB
MNSILLKLSFVLFALLLSACVHKTSITPPANLITHQQQLDTINKWQLRGKLGVKSLKNSNGESGSASIRWENTNDNYTINLSGPLGQKNLRITGQPNKVLLEQTGEVAMEAISAETLLQKTTGWQLPVSQLSYWIRGLPAPKIRIAHLQQNELGLIAELKQHDWLIRYTDYQDQMMNNIKLPMPKKIIAEHKDIRLTLVIHDWQLEAAFP